MAYQHSEFGPIAVSGWAIGSLRKGDLKSQERLLGNSGWAIRILRVGHQDAKGGPLRVLVQECCPGGLSILVNKHYCIISALF